MDYPDPQARNLDVNGKFQDASFDLPGDMNAVYDELIALIAMLGGTAARGNLAQISTLLLSALNGKSGTGHGHAQADVAGLVAALAGKSATGHGHAQADVTGLVAALAGKSATGHGHAQADVSGLVAALAGKSATGHTHLLANITDVNFSGMVVPFPSSSAPTGFLKCNGAAVSRTSYAALFSVVGTAYGSGNGSTTFNLPDFRGEFIRGWDDSRGIDSGRALNTFQLDEFRAHSHSYDRSPKHTANASNGDGMRFNENVQTGVTGGDETRPRNYALTLCIKY